MELKPKTSMGLQFGLFLVIIIFSVFVPLLPNFVLWCSHWVVKFFRLLGIMISAPVHISKYIQNWYVAGLLVNAVTIYPAYRMLDGHSALKGKASTRRIRFMLVIALCVNIAALLLTKISNALVASGVTALIYLLYTRSDLVGLRMENLADEIKEQLFGVQFRSTDFPTVCVTAIFFIYLFFQACLNSHKSGLLVTLCYLLSPSSASDPLVEFIDGTSASLLITTNLIYYLWIFHHQKESDSQLLT